MDGERAGVEPIEGKQFEGSLYSIGTDVNHLENTLAELKEHGREPTDTFLEGNAGSVCFCALIPFRTATRSSALGAAIPV